MTPIGALFARASALFARHPGALLGVFAVVWVPQIVVALLTAHAIPVAATTYATPVEAMRAFAGQLAAQAPYAAFILLVAPLGDVAIIALASGYVAGERPAASTALVRALRLWAPAVAVSLLGALATVVVLAGAALGWGIVSALAMLIAGSVSRGAAGPVSMGAGFVAMLLGFVLTGFVWATLAIATVTLVLEDAHPLRAAGIALRRVLDGRIVRRVLRIGCIYVGVMLGTGVLLDALAWPLARIANGALAALVSALGSAVVNCVLVIFLLLFTLELRVDREGADLFAAVDTVSDADERALIERFLARRDTLVAAARSAIAARIADRMRPKLRASFDHLDDEALLEHLARSTF